MRFLLPVAVGVLALGGAAHAEAVFAERPTQECFTMADGHPLCGPAQNIEHDGPSITCLHVGTGQVCQHAPQFAFDRRMLDAVDGRNGAPDPARLYLLWALCNDAGQWHDTAGCNRVFPDVRHPRPIE
jgi:hypothetical protein